MEREKINLDSISRIIQQKNNLGEAYMVDNRSNQNQNLQFDTPLQRVSEEEEDSLQGKFDTPLQKVEDEETIQGKLESPVQRVSEEDKDTMQGKFDTPIQKKNETGMPDNLKTGIESLSGFSMDNVRVHYNSSKPATVQALAYTQGTDIHVSPGQEKHLPHEAWHVAQQMAGRVTPTTNINGMPVNDNEELEHEADVMGEKAVQCKKQNYITQHPVFIPSIIQKVDELSCNCKITYRKDGAKGALLNAVGTARNGENNDDIVVNCFKNWGLSALASVKKASGGNKPGHCAEPQSVYNALNNISNNFTEKEKKVKRSIAIDNIEISNAVITDQGFDRVKHFYDNIVEKTKHGQEKLNIKKYNEIMPTLGELYQEILHHLLIRNGLIKNDKTKNKYDRCATCCQWVPQNKVIPSYLPKEKIKNNN